MKKLLISFSGGRTSAFMTWWLLNCWDDRHLYEIIVVFANTGKEREETLEFVRDCDRYLGFNTVWIETVMQEYGKGASFKIVTFETASRDGEPFRAIIAKHGIPNVASKHCTREMKRTPIMAYVRSFGWMPKDYETAIGFRIDEPKRWTGKKIVSAKKKKHIYPLVYWHPMKKQDINAWWAKQSFNLNLKDHEGNCDLCWKKHEPKLIAILGMEPDRANWWEEMEREFENYTPDSRKHNELIKPPHRFFRNNMSIGELKEMAKKYFAEAQGDETAMEVYEQALVNGYNPNQISLCSESCEAF